ncbi:MAG: hypothetical protein NXH72_11385 [Hyphomonadaceae bacterium]|nr:hypothetical protein [Hyphomonadaceae bacterium]
MVKAGTTRRKRAVGMAALILSVGLIAACGGGGGGGSTTPGGGTSVSPPPPPPPPPPPNSVTISGQVTFDKVPHNNNFRGLNYDAITQEPARGVVVQAVDASGSVLDTDVTDGNGNYDVDVNSNTDVRIRVRSELQQSSGATWDIQVLDNTSSNAIYVLNGSLTSSGISNSTRNLNAGSGWGGASYTGTRAAGPFSILDAIYDTVTDIAAVDPDVSFPALQVLWSVNNVPTNGNVADGEIGTSSYTRSNGVPTIRILGAENNDTDEYDIHVIVHEFGHYFEDQLSRSDSPGGSHSLSNRLDARLAFGEGWGNAFSAMILDDPIYRDALNAQQAGGFAFSVEDDLTPGSSGTRDPGWFNEASVQQILYDIYDSADDGADTISGGLAPLYAAFTDPAYISNVDFTTIFAFANRIRNESSVSASVLDAMLVAEDINGTGSRGLGETNNGAVAQSLPVYKTVTQGGGAVIVCSTDDNGDTNKHGVREYISLTLTSTGAVTMTATETAPLSSVTETDPDFRIWETGQLFTRDTRGQDRRAESTADGSEIWTGTLDAGTYAIEFYDFNKFDETPEDDSCFSFTVT